MKKFLKKTARRLTMFLFESEYLFFEDLSVKLVASEKNINKIARKLEIEHSEIKKTKDRLKALIDSASLSVDVHDDPYSINWAVFNLEGKECLYMKFIDLGRQDLKNVINFMRQFENVRYDASPETSRILKAELNRNTFI